MLRATALISVSLAQAAPPAARPAEPPPQVTNGNSKDREGNLYVAGETERKLYRIRVGR